MSFDALFLQICGAIALVILSLSFLIVAFRVIVGPTLPDRVLALDTMTVVAIGFIAVAAAMTGLVVYADIAIALGLVGFLATVAFSRFIIASRGNADRDVGNEEHVRK
ncbi:cation:proton antiporter [Corticibacterium sp. UT-5YL-CI-8]|nr:cation:proton antiporter [Tianweitania sp. UT-5YL-CI-8]